MSASQGWCPTVIDTNGDGVITKPWNQPAVGRVTGDEDTATGRLTNFDPKRDTRVQVSPYGIIVNPVDKTLWGATDEVEVPGQIFRVDRGSNPPLTCKTELYMLPKERGYRPEPYAIVDALMYADGGQRATGQLRPPQVQGIRRAVDCRRPSMRRGLDILSGAGPCVCRRRCGRRIQLLQLGRSVQHTRSW